MNKTLIIYDLNGTVIQQVTGFYKTPSGVPYIEVEVPSGKCISRVDVVNKEPVYIDIPKDEIGVLTDKITILEESQKAILRGDMQTLAYNLYPEDFPVQ